MRVSGKGWVEGPGSVLVAARHGLHASNRQTSVPLKGASHQDDSREQQAWIPDVHVRAPLQGCVDVGPVLGEEGPYGYTRGSS